MKLDFSFADAFVVATAENASIAQLNGSNGHESQTVYGTVELRSHGGTVACWVESIEKMRMLAMVCFSNLFQHVLYVLHVLNGLHVPDAGAFSFMFADLQHTLFKNHDKVSSFQFFPAKLISVDLDLS